MSKSNKRDTDAAAKTAEKSVEAVEPVKKEAPRSETKKTEQPVLNFTSRRVWPD